MSDDAVAEPLASEKSRRLRIVADESGLALVWMTLFLMVLIGFAALAVDLGHGYYVAQRAQNAADAAALAGTVYLPSDPATAYSTVQTVAAANGFANSATVNVTASQEPVKTQLKVTVSETVPTWFAKALGFNSFHVVRSAVADYDQPVAMGSPSNTFGNQPDCTTPCTTGNPTPQFWANVEGPDTAKVQGNAFTTRWCSATLADNCAQNSYGNSDYDPNGYYYLVRNTAVGGSLNIDIFDAPFVDVGSNCTSPSLNTVVGQAPPSDAARYAPGGWGDGTGGTSPYCTGDQNNFGDNAGGPADIAPTDMRFTVYEPDNTPWDFSDNVPIAGCDITVAGYLNAQAAYDDLVNGRPKFRRWWTECSIPSPKLGDYVLQIRTTTGTGSNNFAVRAYQNTPSNGTGVSIFGSSKMGIFANSPGSNNTEFYLARVVPGAAGRMLKLDFFDIGDAGGNGSIQVLPPADSNIATFSNCQYAQPPQNATGPPWGSYTATDATCGVSGITTANYNGQWVEFLVPIPNGYTCDESNPFNCWIKIKYSFNGGVHDVTSWKASLDGNPVRIVK